MWGESACLTAAARQILPSEPGWRLFSDDCSNSDGARAATFVLITDGGAGEAELMRKQATELVTLAPTPYWFPAPPRDFRLTPE
jgi:hypothetical protein